MSRIEKLRKYQIEALKAIEDELIVNNSRKCLVKMFCGTGKSAIMRNFQKKQDVNLIVYVFPSLSLISQFTHDYLKKEKTPILKISSDDNSTTEPYIIQNFLSKLSNKIICVTYQSFATLIENLNGLIIDLCIFDEAHHAVGQTYQQLIFKDCEHSNKQIFFTATPKNANGIVMYEKDLISDCGKMVYDYTYYRGITEEYLNPFEIRLDFYTEHNNHSIYESICRSILASGNNRVLTFHSDVNTDRDTSVNNFVNQLDLDKAFNKILNEEFSEKIGFYTKVKIIGLSSSIVATCPQCLEKIKKSTHRPVAKSCCRYNILENFDKTEENEILIISSCETIGEGIDTKNANMCVFVDPKSSYVSIMQNIGRIVRKNKERPLSTILIPCWVDREKYLNCNGDKEKCDEAIREDLGAQGNFNQILNVMSALRQEDEELYDICLHYPDKNTPKRNLIENFKYLLDENIDYEEYEECETNEEILTQIADNYDVNIEVYTDVDETPTEIYTGYELEDESDDEEIEKTIKLHKTKNEDTEEIIYSSIVQEEGEKIIKQISSSDRKKRLIMNDIQYYGVIYLISFPNGGIYVGQTIQGENVRFKEHLRDTRQGSNLPVHNALRKYYSENPEENKVNLQIIAYANSFEELNELEIKYISEYNSYKGNNQKRGYNLTIGGEGVRGYSWTEEQREKHKKTQLKRKKDRPDIPIKHSIHMKQRFKDNPELRIQHSNKMKKIFSDNPKKKEDMSRIKKQQNENNPEMAKQQSELKLMMYEDKYGIVLKENLRKKTSEIWNNDDYRNKQLEIKKNKFKKEFNVYKDGNLICSFDYVPDCAKALFNKNNDSNINKVLKGERKKHKGYEFKYVN
jgi:superfamily II DNA or RNA helicase